jgi:hypothetical protein
MVGMTAAVHGALDPAGPSQAVKPNRERCRFAWVCRGTKPVTTGLIDNVPNAQACA